MKYFFKNWSGLKKQLVNKYIFLFLDYDGTLTPIAKSPDRAVISYKAKNLLKKLSVKPNYKLVVISGRALADIKRIIGLKNIIYVGNHGFEIKGEKIKFALKISSGYGRIKRVIKTALRQRSAGIKGIFIEDKGPTLALHYRQVNKKKIAFLKAVFKKIVSPFGKKIQIKKGKMFLEVRPPLNWNKGRAVLWILRRQPRKKKILPVYLGDDYTDEDAFRVLRKRGLTVFVGKAAYPSAEYYLNSTKEVIKFLNRILITEKSFKWAKR